MALQTPVVRIQGAENLSARQHFVMEIFTITVLSHAKYNYLTNPTK
jgi:hypothetical protein